MKKTIYSILVAFVMIFALAACSGSSEGDSGVNLELKNIGTSQALVGTVSNNSDKDVSATVTVTWYNENDEQLGYSVSEIPYLFQGDSAFDVFDFGEGYDHYDFIVETGEPTDEAIAFYSNLTVEGTMDENGVIEYKAGGGNGEEYEANLVVLYINEDDDVIDYTIEPLKGSGLVSGTIDACKTKGCSGYIMNILPTGMMGQK